MGLIIFIRTCPGNKLPGYYLSSLRDWKYPFRINYQCYQAYPNILRDELLGIVRKNLTAIGFRITKWYRFLNKILWSSRVNIYQTRLFNSPNGAWHTSPGQRPGNQFNWIEPWKGVTVYNVYRQTKLCHALSGLMLLIATSQGVALGWYVMPFQGSIQKVSIHLRYTIIANRTERTLGAIVPLKV